MKGITLGVLATLLCSAICSPTIAQSESTDLRTKIEAIQSVEQVKQEIRETMQQREQCAVGSCHNFNSTAICEAVGALDIRVDGKIFSQGTGWTDNVLPISAADLALMQQIFNQCKPSNYQYWNFGAILHVLYQPTPAADAAIRRQLGLPPKPERR